MLEAKDVFYTFSHATSPSVKGVSLSVSPGELVAVVGANGSGKSTLGRLLCGLYAPSSGSVMADGVNPAHTWNKVGTVFQDPQSQLVSEVVYDEVAFGLENLGLSKSAIRERVLSSLELCGISYLQDAKVSNLSGGEQQLLALAAEIALQPPYLVLDEPTSMLDSFARNRFLKVLLHLVSRGMGVVLITHRQDEMKLAHRVVELSDGNILRGIDAFACEDHSSLHMPPEGVRESRIWSATGALGIEHVKAVRGSVIALDDVSVRALPGHITLVLGRSGSGKSTLALVSSGIISCDRGMAHVEGHRVSVGDVGLCTQRPEDQLFKDTVLEDVMFGPLNDGMDADAARKRAGWALQKLHVPECLWDRSPWSLSGGERRRVAVAAIIAMSPAAYVFDEPTAALDEAGRHAMRAVARELADEGKPVVVVSHDEQEWLSIADDVVFLREGSVVYAGSVREVLQSPDGFILAGLLPPQGIAGNAATHDEAATESVRKYTQDHRSLGIQTSNAVELVKIAGLIVASIVLLCLRDLAQTAAFAAAALCMLYLGGMRMRDMAKLFKALVVVLLFGLVANAVVVDGSYDLVGVGFVGLSSRGVMQGLLVMLRIIALTSLVMAYARTTTPSRVAKALVAPFAALGLGRGALGTLSTTLMLTLRSIPYAVELFRRIEAAQLVRKAPLHRGAIGTRLGAWVSVLTPAIVSLAQHGNYLALALQGRGFGAQNKTTEEAA